MVGVFITTAVFSTFAYIWFFLTLVVISPGVVSDHAPMGQEASSVLLVRQHREGVPR